MNQFHNANIPIAIDRSNLTFCRICRRSNNIAAIFKRANAVEYIFRIAPIDELPIPLIGFVCRFAIGTNLNDP